MMAGRNKFFKVLASSAAFVVALSACGQTADETSPPSASAPVNTAPLSTAQPAVETSTTVAVETSTTAALEVPSTSSTLPEAVLDDIPSDTTVPVATVQEPESTSTTQPPLSEPVIEDELPAVNVECLSDDPLADLNDSLGQRNGSYGGGDYQRAFDLGDGRVLWVMQDVFLSSSLVHNAAFLQVGSCFDLLNSGTDNWIYESETADQRNWFWIFDANVIADQNRIELVVAEMVETGSHYLNRVRVTGTSIVTVDTNTFEVLSTAPFQSNPDVSSSSEAPAFYGWSIVDNAGDGYRYLWSHCYAQFGFDGIFGFAACSNDMFLARVAGPSITGQLEYWTGSGWSSDSTSAASVINFFLTGSGNNPGDVAFDSATGEWRLVVKLDDWWGETVKFASAPQPFGPWEITGEVNIPVKCSDCNTYYASWVPFEGSSSGAWSLGHNHWSIGHTSHYFPTFYRSTS
jgi:hypothetical protein